MNKDITTAERNRLIAMVINWGDKDGVEVDADYFIDNMKKWQIEYALEHSLQVIDVERWIILCKVFGLMKFDTAEKVMEALDLEGIEVLESNVEVLK